MEQLLTSLMPTLQGDDDDAWFDAGAQLQDPVKDISKSQSGLASLAAEVEALQQACILGHQPDVHNLAAVLEGLKSWLCGAEDRLANYRSRAAELRQWQDSVELATRAKKMMRRK